MKYTKAQITELWNLLLKDEEKRNKIQDGLGLMSESSYPPFIDFYNLFDVVAIFDKDLDDKISYVLYECRTLENGGWVKNKDGKECRISGDLKGLLAYLKFE